MLYVLLSGVLSRYVRARARYAHTRKRWLNTVVFDLGRTASDYEKMVVVSGCRVVGRL